MIDEPRSTERSTAGPHRAIGSHVAAWWARRRRRPGHRQGVLHRALSPDLGRYVTATSADLDELLDRRRVVVGGRVDTAFSAVLTGVGPRVLWLVDDGLGVRYVAVPVEFPTNVALGWAQGQDVIALGRVVGGTLVADRVWTLHEVQRMGPGAFAQLIAAGSPGTAT